MVVGAPVDVRVRDEAEGGGETCARILAALPTWFGIEASVNDYVHMAATRPTIIATLDGMDVGIAIVTVHTAFAAELALLAVVPQLHRRGIGSAILRHGEVALARRGIEFLQVKTLSPSKDDEGYARTRAFYEAYGFRPFEELPLLWNKDNPALVMVKAVPPARPDVLVGPHAAPQPVAGEDVPGEPNDGAPWAGTTSSSEPFQEMA